MSNLKYLGVMLIIALGSVRYQLAQSCADASQRGLRQLLYKNRPTRER